MLGISSGRANWERQNRLLSICVPGFLWKVCFPTFPPTSRGRPGARIRKRSPSKVRLRRIFVPGCLARIGPTPSAGPLAEFGGVRTRSCVFRFMICVQWERSQNGVRCCACRQVGPRMWAARGDRLKHGSVERSVGPHGRVSAFIPPFHRSHCWASASLRVSAFGG